MTSTEADEYHESHESRRRAVSTPGRICLFGEHQDYLGLPVIAAAISKRVVIEGGLRQDRRIAIELPDIAARQEFDLSGSLAYQGPADYFRSGLRVLQQAGLTFSYGLQCRVRGDIPIRAGTASSSALVVAWIHFLARMSDQQRELPPERIAALAYQAEVLEFGEAGGMMDQYTAALGGVLFIDPKQERSVERLPPRLGPFVLGDSRQLKDTQAILTRVKQAVLRIVERITAAGGEARLSELTLEQIDAFAGTLSAAEVKLMRATLENRDLTLEGRELLRRTPLDGTRFGALLNRHQANLRDVLGISTPRIDAMLEAALEAGACGGKINGSGGGGCMFAYAPENAEAVAEAVERAGGRAHIVSVDEGTRRHG